MNWSLYFIHYQQAQGAQRCKQGRLVTQGFPLIWLLHAGLWINSEDSYAPWGLFQVKCPIQGLIPWPFPEIKLFKEFVRRSSCKRFTQLTKRTMTFATVMDQLPLPSPMFTLILLLFLTTLIFLRCSGLEKQFCKILSESHVHCTAISYEL